MKRSFIALGTMAAACLSALTSPVQAAGFSTVSYNVAGLLEGISSGSPAANTPLISCKIKGYTLVNVQEDFNYHAALYDTCDDHTYRSATSGGMGIGSGLNTLSYLPYQDWYRGDWNDCNGVDCLTPKGWTHARVRLAEGVYLSLYNLHTQAQTEEADLVARRKNILQLLSYIETNSPTDAIIVMGDTNTRYTRSGDNIREFLKRGFKDVWIEKKRGGSLPTQGAASLMDCRDLSGANCEIVDKVLYRGNPFITLTPNGFLVDNAKFVDAAGKPLSDHYPVIVDWSWNTSSNYILSDLLGGPHGTAFNDVGTLPATAAVQKIVMRAGERVDRVESVLSNGHVMSHGGTGGSERSLTLGSNEHLTSVDLCSEKHNGHTRIFHAKFTTSSGRTLSGGTTTSNCVTYRAPNGYQIVGFHGRSDSEVDKLGAVYMPIPGSKPPAASYLQIVNRQSGMCLDINGGKMADGTLVGQWNCSGADWQKWSYDAHTGLVRSKKDPRYCLDNGGVHDNGARLKIWSCNGNANQRFNLNASTGVLAMRTNPSQVADAVVNDGSNAVITYSNWGGANQRWNFTP
ncbi:MAG: ricin-type beta-trefoil lectin domain protein [Pseudomonadota bacterium]